MKQFSKMTMLTVLLGGLTTMAVANNVAVNQQAIRPAATTVKQAMTLKDETPVQLKGYVVKALGQEKYQFRDATGTMTVEIDDELWRGQPVSATTPVTLTGEVDIDYRPAKRVEIDVDQVSF
jgi:uncharacterized protein (TIGR00156 family)